MWTIKSTLVILQFLKFSYKELRPYYTIIVNFKLIKIIDFSAAL